MTNPESESLSPFDSHARRVSALASEIARVLGEPEISQLYLREACYAHGSTRHPACAAERLMSWLLSADPESQAPLSNESARILAKFHTGRNTDRRSGRLASILSLADVIDEAFEFRRVQDTAFADVLSDLDGLVEGGYHSCAAVSGLRLISSDEGENVFVAAQKLPVSAVGALRRLAITAPDDVTPEMLNELALCDPVISAGILRLVNSAAYPLLKPISSVLHAIRYLGVDTARNAILACAARALCVSSSLRALWQHSIAVAADSQSIAESCGFDSDQAFLAGLLHDIGRFAIAALPFKNCVTYMNLKKTGIPCEWAEWIAFQNDHAALGGMILDRWSIPAVIADAVRGHHAPERSSSPLSSVLYVAELQNENEESIWAPERLSYARERLGLTQIPGRNESAFRASLRAFAA